MTKWKPSHGIKLIPYLVDDKEFDFALEQAAQVIYKCLLRIESERSKNSSTTAPSLQKHKEIRA